MKRKISLPEFIDQVGVNKLAQIFCLERTTIRKWRTGAQLPTATHMMHLVKLSKGRMSYNSIIEPWAEMHPDKNVNL